MLNHYNKYISGILYIEYTTINNNDLFKLLWSGRIDSSTTTTTNLSSSASNYTLLLIIYSVALDYFSTIAVKGCLTSLKATNADSSYYQTTYQREITINDSNFVATQGEFGRTNEFGNFGAIIIKYIYGIK